MKYYKTLCLHLDCPSDSLIACCCQCNGSDSHHQTTKDNGMREPVESILFASRTQQCTEYRSTHKLRERLDD